MKVKVIFAKQLQRKPRNPASTGFEPMTSVIRCTTLPTAMKPCWKQVKCEFNLYPLYKESEWHNKPQRKFCIKYHVEI